ncbi:hypothetical protein [Nocardia huaxiensis]|uniref:hypothetical protein n=1 Tax=Nocardia huaxiensis TaxID=2755382 RepID=UPI001E3CB90E|nr:hypothetical protein [Nocardia huaxiensis]UFS93410.1 hypothetical protein LPY97_21515 [Nocardia huaxiensis]
MGAEPDASYQAMSPGDERSLHLNRFNRNMLGKSVLIRSVVAGCFVGAAFTSIFGAGSASAVQLYGPHEPGDGPYVGLTLTHDETVAVANSPIPAILDGVIPNSELRYALNPGSTVPVQDSRTDASVSDVVTEAARHPDGIVSLVFTDPAYYRYQLWIRQYWR